MTAPFDMADAAIERYVLDDIHTGLASADGGNVVLDFVDPDGAGSQPMQLAKRYLYGAAVDQILAQEDVAKTLGDAARVLWPLTDNLGTTRDVARQDGTIATHLKYDAYGNVTGGDTSLTRYLFTSRELDTDTGLQYNRARWYDAAVGRWLSEDPLGFAAGDGNVSQYVGNWVTFGRDPSGMWLWPWDDNASWRFDPGFFDDIYGSGATLSDPDTAIGQLIAGDIYGNQIWGDPGIGASFTIPVYGPVTIGGGVEVIYDWANDGTPGTGWHIYIYPQGGLSVGASGSVMLQQTYNFVPEDYTGPFIHKGGAVPVPGFGGAYFGISRTPDGVLATADERIDTDPYTYYSGWAPSFNLQYMGQFYVQVK